MEIKPEAIRRIVTGHNDAGRSVFIMDGHAPQVFRPGGGVVSVELWETRSSPADNRGAAEVTDHPVRLHPPQRGSVFRIIRFMPADEYQSDFDEKLLQDNEGSGLIDALRKGAAGRARGFHATATTDYVIVLSGEIFALMDEGEVLMKAGDVLIQRGTNHAWVNRSGAPAVLAFVLIDAEPVKFER